MFCWFRWGTPYRRRYVYSRNHINGGSMASQKPTMILLSKTDLTEAEIALMPDA